MANIGAQNTTEDRIFSALYGLFFEKCLPPRPDESRGDIRFL